MAWLVANTKVDEVIDVTGKFFPLFTGIFSDFEPSWYSNVGVNILFSMLLYSITSQVAFFLMKIIAVLSRCFDSGCGCDGKTTKKLTKSKYFQTYVGPNFDIGTRYSEVYIWLIII